MLWRQGPAGRRGGREGSSVDVRTPSVGRSGWLSPRGGKAQAGTWGRVCEGGWARPLRTGRKMDRDGDGVGPVSHGQ